MSESVINNLFDLAGAKILLIYKLFYKVIILLS